MFNFKKKSQLSIELNDYIVRAIVKKGAAIADWEAIELPLEQGILEDATLLNELALFDLLKENLPKFGGKNQTAKIFVPDTTVLLKKFEHPQELEGKKLKDFLQMEIGQSIHLPFQDPLVDVYDPIPGDGQAILFAAPSEDVQKIVGILLDLNLVPEAADIRALCNLRLLERLDMLADDQTYLIADWSINELSICIYSNGQVEFLRFQSIDTDMTKWKPEMHVGFDVHYTYNGDIQDYRMHVTDQVLELDRMMNFFKFSLHKGEKSVNELILMGDNPILETISDFLSDNLVTPIKLLTNEDIQKVFPQFKVKHATLLGLALKEVIG